MLFIAHAAGLSLGQEALDTALWGTCPGPPPFPVLFSPETRGIGPSSPAKCLPGVTIRVSGGVFALQGP